MFLVTNLSKFLKNTGWQKPPGILYKYISDEKLKYYLPKLTLAYPKLALLNDPMEAVIEDMIKYKKNVSDVNIDHVLNNSMMIPDRAIPGLAAYIKMRKRSEANALLEQKRSVLSRCKNSLGILSLTTNPLNPLMRSHYANTYKGICIGFSREGLTDRDFADAHDIGFQGQGLYSQLDSIGHYKDYYKELLNLRRVRYRRKAPKGINLSVQDYITVAFTTKFKRWGYEEEYRLIKPIYNKDHNILIEKKPTDIIKEIYIGSKSVLNDTISTIPHDVKIFKVKQDPHTYRLLSQEVQ